jgi:energy-coupling factor transporter ATP-binding protein EcfA2
LGAVGARPLPIAAEGVRFRYAGADRAALAGVDFRIDAGGVLLVVGPSGSGKSTLARAIAGLVPRDVPGEWSGSLRVGDLETATASPAAVSALVGVLFQDPGSQLVMDRAGDDVAFGLENRAWPLLAMRERVPTALAGAGLAGFEDRRGTRLSGGEQQRLALAGVEAPRPGVLVLDEPTANLDLNGATALFARLASIRAERAATVVLVEHRADLAWPLADVVLAIDGSGRPIDLGPPGAVLERSGARLAGEGIWLPGDLATGGMVTRPDGVGGARDGQPPSTSEAGTATGPADGLLVRLAGVRFAYPSRQPAVLDIDLEVAAGERVALVGPNGSGKSTLLRLVAGLLRPDAGTVRLAGEIPWRMAAPRLAALVGYVFQDPELGFVADTVAGEIGLGLDHATGMRAATLMDRLGLPLDRFGERSPYRLSGGEQRRLSVATALARSPRLLVLDEPTFGQDRRGWEAMAAIVGELVAGGTAVLAATHDRRFAATVADRRVSLERGRITDDDGRDAAFVGDHDLAPEHT